jgi:hypothetical protein
MIALLAWIAAAAGATPEGCAAPVDLDAFDEAIANAEAAIATLDQQELEHAARRAREAATCLDTLLPARQIARLYRASGVALFTAGDPAGAWDAFAVAKELDPEYELDPALGPPMRKLYGAVPARSERAEVGAPISGWGVVDGRATSDAPSARPYFAQWFEADGTVRENFLVPTGAPPPYAKALPVERDPVPGRGTQLAATGLGFLVVGAGAIVAGELIPDPNAGRVANLGGATFGMAGAFMVGLAVAR